MPRSVEPSAVKVVASRKNKGELRAKGAGSVPSADRLHRLPLRVCVQEPDNSGDTFEFAAITPPPHCIALLVYLRPSPEGGCFH